jgi:hypothetical protein
VYAGYLFREQDWERVQIENIWGYYEINELVSEFDFEV